MALKYSLKLHLLLGSTLFSFLLLIGCSTITEQDAAIVDDSISLSGGSSTVFDQTRTAFGHKSPNLTGNEDAMFEGGEFLFDTGWVSAPSTTSDLDGLGPYFNANSCAACHRRDGRGRPPEPGEAFLGLLIRLSIPGQGSQGPTPDENYGGQLQGNTISKAIAKEGNASVTYTEISGSYPDGETYTLTKPTYTISDLGYGALHSSVMMSPRVAPVMIGLGLLERVSESDILSLADEFDADGDGISGRPNYVWDAVNQESNVLGRFGWKANQPSLHQQVAGAFSGDMGITSPLFPNENITSAQTDETKDVIHGGTPEISQDFLDLVIFYSQHLAVPARRNIESPQVLLGEAKFKEISCTACHRPEMTSDGETIRPYTDLLLHDMGDELADNRPDFEADGNEWRTPPLWGIGLVETVNGHTRFLHDGRARNLEEAILWHGGEAEASKEQFKSLSKEDRTALITFLESL